MLAVLLFHLDIPGFSGGFVGVDIFFVISGYLITKNIYSDLNAGQFGFKRFYVRRIYRLLPALLVTIFATLLASYFILTPEHFSNLGGASVASVFSVSNILFWSEAGYFDDAKTFKPLLHTWSLAVEEQFYLLWPLLLFFLHSKGKSFSQFSIILLAVISLLAAQSLFSDHSALVFYWMPLRISEFAIGAVLVFVSRSPCSSWRASFAAVAGLVLTLAPIFVYSDQTSFPGVMALLPCVGTLMLIHFGRAPVVFPLLANALCRQLGKISYSLYLVHWPVIVLVSYWKLGGIGAKSLVVVVPLIFVLAWVLHHQVEQRFRLQENDIENPKKSRGFVVCLAMTLLFAGSVSLGNGWSWRYSDEAQPVLNAVHGLSSSNADKLQLIEKYQASFISQNNVAQHFVIGDSFAEDTMLALKFALPDLNLKLLKVRAECQPVLPSDYDELASVSRWCNQERERVYDVSQLKYATTIYLAASWREPAFSHLSDAIDFLNKNTSAKIVVVGPRASFHDVPTLAVKHGKKTGLDEFVNGFKLPLVTSKVDALRLVADQAGAEFIDVYRIMCPDDICIIISPADKKILYSDYAHLTISGAKHFAEGLLKQSVTD